MRAVFAAALGILVLGMLSGCDLVHAPVPRTEAVAQQPCNCIPPPPEHLTRLEPPAPHYYRHHYRHRDYRHRDVAQGYSSHSYREYESAEMAQYEYRSASSVSSGSYEGYGEADGGYAHEDRGYDRDDYRDRDYWTDGYGRQHFSGGDVTRVAADTRKRLDPWHGYGVYCPDEDRE